MARPLATITHTTREVRRALASNCWYVYHRPTPAGDNPAPAPARVTDARTQRGRFQVRDLQTGRWRDVAPADALYQS